MNASVVPLRLVGVSANGMDWTSDIYNAGTRRCVELADRYLAPGSRVLDFGCGMGLVSLLLHEMGHRPLGVDIDIANRPEKPAPTGAKWATYEAEIENPELIRDSWRVLQEHYGIEFETFDGTHVPAEDGAFDAVVAHAVYEHIEPDELPAVLGEVGRVTRQGGHFFVFRTPRELAYLEKLSSRLGMAGHERLCEEEAVSRMLGEHGFEVGQAEVTDLLPSFVPKGQ